MKYIVIGLGKLGKVLATSLTSVGHEVIGVDKDMKLVEAAKDMVSETVCMDMEDENAVKTLPLKDADAVYVTFGEDFGSSVSVSAILKQQNTKRIIVRAISPLHETILRAIGINEILTPEYDYSQEYIVRKQLENNIQQWYKVTSTHHLIRIKILSSLVGNIIRSVDFKESFNLELVAVLRPSGKKNLIGQEDKRLEVLENIDENTVFEADDQLVIFGKPNDYNRLNNM